MKLNDFNIVLRDAGVQDYLLTDGNLAVINTYLQKLDALNQQRLEFVNLPSNALRIPAFDCNSIHSYLTDAQAKQYAKLTSGIDGAVLYEHFFYNFGEFYDDRNDIIEIPQGTERIKLVMKDGQMAIYANKPNDDVKDKIANLEAVAKAKYDNYVGEIQKHNASVANRKRKAAAYSRACKRLGKQIKSKVGVV